MALVARFGFENNSMLPENVSLIDNNISVDIPCNKFTTGRNDGTALVGYGYAMYDIANQVTKSFCGGVRIKTMPVDQIYTAYYCKLLATGSVHCTGSLIEFGDASVKFDAYNAKFMLCVTESIIKTSSVFDWPIDSWIQVKCSIGIGISKNVSITLNGVTLDATTNTSPSGKLYADTLSIYSGMTQDMSITGVSGFTQVPSERCKFAIDDIAVNNSIQYGVAKDYDMPPFISCIKLIPSASSITSGWQSSTSASILESLADTSSFIRGKLSDSPTLTIFPTNGNLNQQSTISAINIAYIDAKREGQENLVLNSYIKNSDCSFGVTLRTTKISYTDTILPSNTSQFDSAVLFSTGIPIKYSHYKNYNFFGRKILGDVRYTSSIALGNPNEFTVLEYNNLIIDSTATIKKTLNCKGLFFYVNGTFVLSGSILASNGMTSSADIADQSDFIYYKNTAPIDLDTESNIINTLDIETTTQPILSGSTISTDLSIYKKNLTGSSFATYFPGINGSAGYGGSACNAFNSSGSIFGLMASSSIYGGGMSINHWTSSVAYDRYYGGGLIGVIAKNILISSTGKLLCSGTVSPEGWYGSGGGIVRLMYSDKYLNIGTIDVSGAGSYGVGGSGSALVTKIASFTNYNTYVSASGGVIINVGDYTTHTFTTDGLFTVTDGGYIDMLIVGGGGGGGHTTGGGGGGGEVVNVTRILGVGSYSVTIGTGGAGATNGVAVAPNGGTTIFNGISALGGGGAGSDYNSGGSGACGGGSGWGTDKIGGAGSPGYSGGGGSGVWNSGGVAGGGGGMSAAGTSGASGVAGRGGEGIISTITGVPVVYGSGGGGGASGYGGGTANVGGTNGGTGYKNADGGAGTANTGGGGGGGGYTGTTGQWKGGAGGSGIVVVRYKNKKERILDSFADTTELFILPNTNSLTDRSPNNWSLSQSSLTINTNTLWNGYYSIDNPNGYGRWTGPANALLQPGSGAFTIDSILVLTGNSYNSNGTNARLVGCEASYVNAWYLDFLSPQNGFPTGIVFGSAALGVSYSWNYAFVINTTYHIAVQRINNELSLWINGIKQSTVYTTTSNFDDSSRAINGMSRNDQYTQGLRCKIYMLRLVKNAALFTSNFTPDFSTPPVLI